MAALRVLAADELNVIATYPIAPVADSRNPESAQAFIEFVLGPTGQELLAGQGFISISKE
jgi:molybdate transport system substrate-binding protein